MRWLYPFRAMAVGALLALYAPVYRELAWPPRLPLARVGLTLAVGVAVFVLWINCNFPWANLGGASSFDPTRADGALDLQLVAVRILGAGIVVPVMEELFWRSFLMRWIDSTDFLSIDPKSTSLRAVIVSSALFASEHSLWFAGLLAGLAYAWLYRRTGNLWVPTIAHAVTNIVLGIWVVWTHRWEFW